MDSQTTILELCYISVADQRVASYLEDRKGEAAFQWRALRRGDDVTLDRLKHIDRFMDRHGKPRYYFRARRGRRTRLPGEPGSIEFMEAYRRAVKELSSRTAHKFPERQVLQEKF